MLHPNLKSFNHTPHKKYYAEALLKSEFEEYQQREQQYLSSNNKNKKKRIQQQKNTRLEASLDDIFDLPKPLDKLQAYIEVKTEFDKCLEDERKIDKDMNVLVYWNNNKSLYPTLAKIAQRILSIPATNTCVERIFSNSGNTITNCRTRVQTSKVNQLLFIHRNLTTLRELFPPSMEQLTKRKNSCTFSTPMKKKKHSKGEDDDKENNDNIQLINNE